MLDIKERQQGVGGRDTRRMSSPPLVILGAKNPNSTDSRGSKLLALHLLKKKHVQLPAVPLYYRKTTKTHSPALLTMPELCTCPEWRRVTLNRALCFYFHVLPQPRETNNLVFNDGARARGPLSREEAGEIMAVINWALLLSLLRTPTAIPAISSSAQIDGAVESDMCAHHNNSSACMICSERSPGTECEYFLWRRFNLLSCQSPVRWCHWGMWKKLNLSSRCSHFNHHAGVEGDKSALARNRSFLLVEPPRC